MTTATTLPWRIEGNLPLGVSDPDIAVYFGDTYTNNADGNVVLHQDHSKRMLVKLSELNTFLANPVYQAPPVPQPPAPPATPLTSLTPVPPTT